MLGNPAHIADRLRPSEIPATFFNRVLRTESTQKGEDLAVVPQVVEPRDLM